MKKLLFAVSAAVVGGLSAAVVDIPFWGQENPPTNRTASASAPQVVPAGTDFRVKTVAASASIPFYTGPKGLVIIIR